jgi:hypothetical protein
MYLIESLGQLPARKRQDASGGVGGRGSAGGGYGGGQADVGLLGGGVVAVLGMPGSQERHAEHHLARFPDRDEAGDAHPLILRTRRSHITPMKLPRGKYCGKEGGGGVI